MENDGGGACCCCFCCVEEGGEFYCCQLFPPEIGPCCYICNLIMPSCIRREKFSSESTVIRKENIINYTCPTCNNNLFKTVEVIEH